MAVRIQFDNVHNIIPPTFVLATRNGHKLGVIPATNISLSDAFNANFDLEFKVYKYDNDIVCHLWDDITDFKLCWCKEWDVWFEIYVETQDDNDIVKNVSCVSIGEAELSQINLYNIEINTEDDIAREDYKPTVLYNSQDPDASLLHRIMEKAPHYYIKHVDASISGIQRTFTFDGVSIYDAFQDISKEIDCIFIIDSNSDHNGNISRSISVYDIESYCCECGNRGNFTETCPKCGSDNILYGYGEDTSVFVSVENLADSISLKTDVDSVKNCFRLEAGDELMTATIRSCNPNGSQYIWHISDEIKADMSDELVSKLDEYDQTYRYYQYTHQANLNTSIVQKYNALVAKYRQYNPDLNLISLPVTGYPNLMSSYFDTIDMYLFINNVLMPSPQITTTNASLQAARITSDALSPVAVEDIEKCSSSTASSTILSVAKILIDPRYRVQVKEGSLSGNIWTGSFIVTNYADDSDVAESRQISVTINDNYELFIRQKLEKVLKTSENDNDISDIVSVFNLTLNSFISYIRKYSLNGLNILHDACQSCMDILIEQGIANDDTTDLYTSLYDPYYAKLMALQDEIKLRESEVATIVGVYDVDGGLVTPGLQTLIEEERDNIHEILNMEHFLGTDLWLEFVMYRREDSYTNSNYISDGLDNGELFNRALEFIEVAQKEIYKSATLQHSISASLKNLLMMDEFSPIVDKFAVGNWIRVKIDKNIYRLRLISYQIDFEDDLDNLSIEFSDVQKCADGISDSESILNQAASMATTYDTVARQANQGKKGNQLLQDWVNKGLALTKMKIVDSAENQNIIWDSHGFLCREYLPITDEYDKKQLKIINRGLYLTDDNWKTARAGVGNFTFYNPDTQAMEESYGVIADTLVGNLILSQKVGIYNTDNSIILDKDGFKILCDESIVTEFKNDGTFSLGKESLVFDGEKLIISPDVAITWEQITGTDDIASKSDIPTDISDLKNEKGFITTDALKGYLNGDNFSTYITKDWIGTLGLAVGEQILMGENAIISWNNVTGTDNVAVKSDIPDTMDWEQITGTDDVITGSNLSQKVSNAGFITTNALTGYLNGDNFGTYITKNWIGSLGLAVGEQILMGENARITWNNVSNKPSDLAYTSDIPTNLSELSADDKFFNTIKPKVTTITNDAISTCTISANQIKTGCITSQNGLTLFNLNNGSIETWDGDVKYSKIQNGEIVLGWYGNRVEITPTGISLTDDGEGGTEKINIDRQGYIEAYEGITVHGTPVSLEGHTHSGYASSSHTHSNYLSTSGGTITGNLSVNGYLTCKNISTTQHTASSTGYSFVIYNGSGSWVNSNVDSPTGTTYVYLTGGADTAGVFLRSYPIYNRTYSGKSANVFVTDVGTLGRITSSSIRYKHDVEYFSNIDKKVISDEYIIQNDPGKVNENDLLSILDIPVVSFRYNGGYVTGEPDFDYEKPIVGFISDDVAQNCPDCATYIDLDGKRVPESWSERDMIPRMLYVLQKQNNTMEEFDNRLLELTSKVNTLLGL